MNLQVAAGEVLLRALGATWRFEREGEDLVEAARRASPRGNVIFAFWHSALLILSASHRNRDIHVLVSQHRDGEWIARILGRIGYRLVRGSSRRGGVEALFRMANVLEAGGDVAVTVDGPIGPRSRVHPGVVLLARRTGRPIVPVFASYARGRALPTWDALRLPDPWSRVQIRYARHRTIATEGGAERVATEQRLLEDVLRSGTLAAEARFGHVAPLDDMQDRRSYWERVSERTAPPSILRAVSSVHAAARRADRRLRPRPAGRHTRPWVIGVGNLEAGGTGKTPCVVMLAVALERAGYRLAVLTRGHRGGLGRRPQAVTDSNLRLASDETQLLRRDLPTTIPVWVARDKRTGLEALRAEDADLVVVDDAFQTAGLPVDRHLVLLDWERPFGNGYVLPAGRLREPPAALRHAHAVLLTRARGAGGPDLGSAWPGGPTFFAEERCTGLASPAGQPVAWEQLRGRRVALISGLGRPQAFERMAADVAARAGMRIERTVRVGDHAPLESELRKLVGRLEALECSHVVTTAKDVLRLSSPATWNEPLLVLEQRLEVSELQQLVATLIPA